MENSNNQSNQSRFLIAAVLSIVVLFGWSYFFAPKAPENAANTNANTANANAPSTADANTANANNANANTAAQRPADANAPENSEPEQPALAENPARSITIKSPLYEVTLDAKGAVATSWILLKNSLPQGEFPLFGDGSTDANPIPLQLISEKARTSEPREIPFRLSTGDANIDTTVNGQNYAVSVAEDVITLGEG